MTNKASILIVDDIVDNLKLLNEILTTNRFIVRPADNGKLAISSALVEKSDLILLDVRMPDMDGFEVCRQLKSNCATADIPVMFISAYDELSDRLKGFELGAVDFITKPFEPREVIARINTQLELSDLRRESIRQATELKMSNKLLLEKAEEIEAQNEELRVQNEEMADAKRIIEESEEKFRLLYTAMNQGLALHEIILDKDGKPIDYVFIDINDSYTRIVGITREMCIGKRIREVMPDVEQYWIDTFGKVALTGEPCYYENFLKTTGIYYSTFTFSPKKNQFAVLVSDISERKKAEAAILASEARLLEAQRIAHVGNWELDLITNNLKWSAEIFNIFEIDSANFTATYEAFLNMIHPEDRDEVNKAYQQSVTSRQPYKILHRLLLPDGRIKYVQEQCETFYDPTGKPLRSIGIVQDITERKQAEEANQKLQEQLNQAQKMESVGRLAGGVAHDFNNMLSVILGQTQLALMEIEDNNPLKHTLEQITVAAKRSADLTRQLLAFARKQIIVPKVININDTVDGILKLLKRLIGEDISLLWIPATKPLYVKMDPTQVDQLLTNMLINSRDAISGEGEITISSSRASFSDDFCRFNPEVEAGEYVLLQISDNGCGMTKETRDNIFEPFYTTKEVGKGTGLGMATVYGIVKQNHGFISVYSEVGIGTTFKIYLPGYTVNATGEVTMKINEKAPTGTETILIVEDEVSVLEITKAMLESLGYRILPFSVPGEAVDFLKSYDGELDLVISDVIMPSMNGRDLANMFKTMRTDFKTLFMSGYTAENIDRHGMLDTGVCFLQKPFSRKELADKVREALR